MLSDLRVVENALLRHNHIPREFLKCICTVRPQIVHFLLYIDGGQNRPLPARMKELFSSCSLCLCLDGFYFIMQKPTGMSLVHLLYPLKHIGASTINTGFTDVFVQKPKGIQ